MSTAQQLFEKGSKLFQEKKYSEAIEVLDQASKQASQDNNPKIEKLAQQLLEECLGLQKTSDYRIKIEEVCEEIQTNHKHFQELISKTLTVK